jgi:two-component system phosphate regulon response regulator OmpR
MDAHVLIVDDDARLRSLLAGFLKRSGYRVSAAKDARDADLHRAVFLFDLAVLDVMMPGEDGTAYLRRLRRESDLPVIMLTAKGETDDRIEGLEAGADDYLPKPFEPKELLLRMRRLLERSASRHKKPVVRIGAYRFDLATKTLRAGDEAAPLTAREQDMLAYLAERAGTSVSREELAARCGINERSVDVCVTRLRSKFEADPKRPALLQTVRGTGYMLYAEE